MRLDWISVLVAGLMICAVIVGCFYYFNLQYRNCTSNPLVYASYYYKDLYGYEFTGTGRFDIPNSPIISFNSTDVTTFEPYGSTIYNRINGLIPSFNLSP